MLHILTLTHKGLQAPCSCLRVTVVFLKAKGPTLPEIDWPMPSGMLTRGDSFVVLELQQLMCTTGDEKADKGSCV